MLRQLSRYTQIVTIILKKIINIIAKLYNATQNQIWHFKHDHLLY